MKYFIGATYFQVPKDADKIAIYKDFLFKDQLEISQESLYWLLKDEGRVNFDRILERMVDRVVQNILLKLKEDIKKAIIEDINKHKTEIHPTTMSGLLEYYHI
jgi:hypothetical protein